jgi:hypothetical protein
VENASHVDILFTWELVESGKHAALEIFKEKKAHRNSREKVMIFL